MVKRYKTLSSIELQKFVRDLSLSLSLSLSPVFRIVVFDVTVEVKTNG